MPLPQTVLKALELFMLTAAEDAWRELSSGAESEGNFSAAPLTFILERFLTISLDPSRQGLIEGPGPPSILNQFRRMPACPGLRVAHFTFTQSKPDPENTPPMGNSPFLTNSICGVAIPSYCFP